MKGGREEGWEKGKGKKERKETLKKFRTIVFQILFIIKKKQNE